jgi:hypothetical protein
MTFLGCRTLLACSLLGCAATPPPVASVAIASPEPTAPLRMKDGVYRRNDETNNCDYAVQFTYREGQLTSVKMSTSTKHGRTSFTIDEESYPCDTSESTFTCPPREGRCKQEDRFPLTMELDPPSAYDSVSPNGKNRSRYEFIGP